MAELQKHQLLVKLLKMTTSSSDAEALVAMRKANELLSSAGWDWDRLMAGKITVVGDPFANLGNPTPKVEAQSQYEGKKQRYAQAYGGPTGSPAAAPQRRSPPIASTRHNSYEGHCWCCGKLVAVNGGFLFKPRDFHLLAVDAWRVVCATHNNSTTAIPPSPATRSGVGARKVTVDDIA